MHETVMRIIGVRPGVKHMANEVCTFGEKCALFIQTTVKRHEKKSKPEQATVASVRSNQKLGCVSQDVELPEQTV